MGENADMDYLMLLTHQSGIQSSEDKYFIAPIAYLWHVLFLTCRKVAAL